MKTAPVEGQEWQHLHNALFLYEVENNLKAVPEIQDGYPEETSLVDVGRAQLDEYELQFWRAIPVESRLNSIFGISPTKGVISIVLTDAAHEDLQSVSKGDQEMLANALSSLIYRLECRKGVYKGQSPGEWVMMLAERRVWFTITPVGICILRILPKSGVSQMYLKLGETDKREK